MSVSDKIRQKSAAEFFCEHQQIAGFDNPGKSLFTSIRELVENSLDATEIIHKLPNINVKVIEYNEQEHNKLHGIKQKEKKSEKLEESVVDVASVAPDGSTSDPSASTIATPTNTPAKGSKGKDKVVKDAARMYYKIIVEDNGCGMASKDIGNLLGRVLSGSKHGIKQTRGKFGLGAKMALIWSKKSSGLPIEITSAQYVVGRVQAPDVTSMILDMDIYKNEPKVVSSTHTPNADNWHGTVISVTVSGAWTYYKARILQYFQQLAVITPYANIEFDFQCLGNTKKDFHLSFTRRSEQMPATAREILPHPDSLNHITLNKLLMDCPSTNHVNGLYKFLTQELAGISSSVALKIIQNLITNTASNVSEAETLKIANGTHIKPNSLTGKHITALSQILRDERSIKPPTHIMPISNNFGSMSCLSPVGEYNLRLGIIKELRPKLIATYSDVNSNNLNNHYEGHPFVIEAAVALGSQGNPTASKDSDKSGNVGNKTDNDADGTLSTKDQQNGIHIYRFANRIPLLFETGADVVTQVATKQVNWGSYLIDPKKDHIGVFISIVSTKIPYKGTSKEYIGADITEISKAVKSAIQQCGLQLKIQLNLSLKAKHDYERKRTLSKYIPNICNALHGILTLMKEDGDEAEAEAGANNANANANANTNACTSDSGIVGYQELLRESKRAKKVHLLKQFGNGQITVNSLTSNLNNGVCKFDNDQQNAEAGGLGNTKSSKNTSSNSNSNEDIDNNDTDVDDTGLQLESNMSLNMLLSADNISKLGSVTVMDSVFLGTDSPFPIREDSVEASASASVMDIDITCNDSLSSTVSEVPCSAGVKWEYVKTIVSSSSNSNSNTTSMSMSTGTCCSAAGPSSAVVVNDNRVLVRIL